MRPQTANRRAILKAFMAPGMGVCLSAAWTTSTLRVIAEGAQKRGENLAVEIADARYFQASMPTPKNAVMPSLAASRSSYRYSRRGRILSVVPAESDPDLDLLIPNFGWEQEVTFQIVEAALIGLRQRKLTNPTGAWGVAGSLPGDQDRLVGVLPRKERSVREILDIMCERVGGALWISWPTKWNKVHTDKFWMAVPYSKPELIAFELTRLEALMARQPA
jgi:hypothetical protein